jgi:tetratricopeptide (TPR) repeat protein
MGAGWLEPAAREFEAAVRLDPTDAEAQIGLAAALGASGRAQAAVAPAREAARRRPGDAEIQYHLGEVLRLAGRGEEALAAYRESFRLRPRSPVGGYRAATTLAEMGRAVEAVAALAEAQRVGRAADPADPEGERFAALVYARSDPARAIQAWERYLSLMRRLPDPSLLEMGKMLEAMVSLDALRRQQGAPAASRP